MKSMYISRAEIERILGEEGEGTVLGTPYEDFSDSEYEHANLFIKYLNDVAVRISANFSSLEDKRWKTMGGVTTGDSAETVTKAYGLDKTDLDDRIFDNAITLCVSENNQIAIMDSPEFFNDEYTYTLDFFLTDDEDSIGIIEIAYS